MMFQILENIQFIIRFCSRNDMDFSMLLHVRLLYFLLWLFFTLEKILLYWCIITYIRSMYYLWGGWWKFLGGCSFLENDQFKFAFFYNLQVRMKNVYPLNFSRSSSLSFFFSIRFQFLSSWYLSFNFAGILVDYLLASQELRAH